MSDLTRLYTPAEAGAVSGLTLKSVHNAIDKHIVELETIGARLLTGDDLVRLRVWRGVGDTLSAETRRNLFGAIAAHPRAKTVKADDLLIVDVAEARKQVGKGLRDLEAAEAVVVKDRDTMGGEPVFVGTRIPVRGVVAMLDAGATVEDLLSGYPKLTARLIDLAKVWVAAHPRRGRPKSLGELGLTLKSTTRASWPTEPLARADGAAGA